ncbi:Predicted PurR-regulated permease PerM [Austwickia chelonae]|uniref:AI-2E family transporter n=1 Tax=Austwickia chelonae NBRC 105200 TaxID=1184607 RepID=K6WA93_9MICO|nr:AI-2E family transporter [Austwickia chelonae]GAB78757.1 hypothetical protein AUCHE_16_01800 [Austwickia chelonae NBRC 105200]SEW35263.1 Predicted PurR-regulated permease PerM [Austwickia chelonae]
MSKNRNRNRARKADVEAADPVISAERHTPRTTRRIAGAAPTAVATPEETTDPPSPSVNSTVRGMPRIFLIGVGGAGLAYCIMFVQGLGSVIGPVFLALNLMVTAYPLHSWLVRHRVNRNISAIFTGLVVLLVLCAFFTTIGWAITQLVTSLPEYNKQFETLVNTVTERLASVGVTPDTMLKQIQQISPSSVIGVVTPLFANLSSGAGLLAVLFGVVFFMTMDTVSIDERLELARRYHPRFVGGLESFSSGVRRYWIVSSVFGIISAVLDVLALRWIGVPLAPVWGILAFLCNYIPNVGFFIGLVPPALLALLALGPGHALSVIAAYMVLNFVVQSLIMPRFTGQAVGITATLTFVSLLFWSWVLGVLGALLAIPATLLCKSLLVDADPEARWANALIASDPLTYETDDQKKTTPTKHR